ncbi:MAG: DciA family protein [Betaproteobacteria bacterium]
MSGRASAIDWLKAEPAFREVASRLSSMVELQAMVAASYPQSPVTVLSLSDDGTLAVAARNAAEAARLRQLEPTVVARLRQRGAAVQRLRIRSRRTADAVAQAPSGKPRGPIPQDALQAFESLQAQAQSEVLRRALGSLLRHQRAQD